MSESEAGRVLRAGMFTLVCAGLSAHGHALSSGHDVALPGLVLGMAVVFAVAWAASARRLSRMQLTGHMLWGQFALHMALTVTGSFGGGHAGHQQDIASESGSPAWTMVALHVVSALLSAWWLHRGENAFFAFLRFMALTVLPLLVFVGALPAPVSRGRSLSWFPERHDRPRILLLRHARVLRGPPVPSVA
ncbi:hypothetical protein [Nocardiopsis sp. JB363]|uniref:hypothetical protein n=1 Tax=Nocardiopsis sp. JB363 TaxID=1434837 RepID=UPI000B359523|nr:hypothetical protein [Nocardiopsis sp. JB363]